MIQIQIEDLLALLDYMINKSEESEESGQEDVSAESVNETLSGFLPAASV